MSGTVWLIDGDIVAYQAAAGESRVLQEAGEDAWDLSTEKGCKEHADAIIEEWTKSDQTGEIIIAFSQGAPFRRIVWEDYKLHRRGKPKPPLYAETVAHLKDRFGSFCSWGLEADDVLGILSTSPNYHPKKDKIIVSIDKDFLAIPGLLMNPRKGGTITEISERSADTAWMTQTLTGDSTDGYPGCPTIGPKRAKTAIAEFSKQYSHYGNMCEGTWKPILAVFEAAGLSEAFALSQARCARILRYSDRAQKDEVILWEPTNTKNERISLREWEKASMKGESQKFIEKMQKKLRPSA